MKCNKVKALIMDYIDGELSQELRQEIVSHLDSCPSCKQMEQSLRQVVIEPLRRVEKITAPDRVWYSLKETIVNRKRSFLPELISQWSGYFQLRRPVLIPVTTMLIVVIFVTLFFFNREPFTEQNALNAYLQEQAGFSWQLTENGQGSYLDINEVSLGTAIERYLM